MSDTQFPPPPKTVPTITTDSSGEYDFDAEYNGCLTSLMQERDELKERVEFLIRQGTEIMGSRDELKAQLTRLQERDREARELLEWQDFMDGAGEVWQQDRAAFLEKAE